ncbi:MAG: 23S rRNA (guanosine(2251)-2'-O)-methyltransferase RlmB [Rickettsiaceae bacterium]|nr:23S rRNA (guanosine(2251)-2'-O)-methyltransferase RlmB [Rickettsiaceae bacterium]
MKTNKKTSPKNKGQYYMYGTHAVLAAANNKSRKINHIYCLAKHEEELRKEISHIPITTVQNDFITKIVGKDQTHQGVIALVDTIFKNGLESIDLSSTQEKIAILDQISDPQNIGAIIRSAAAFGIKTIILLNDNSPEENATIAKTACGCLELVKIIKVTNLKNTIEKLKKAGFWIAGLDASGNTNPDTLKEISKIAFIIGSEGKGMRRLTAKCCDFLVQIPISKDVESLNASNAASIIFYLMR